MMKVMVKETEKETVRETEKEMAREKKLAKVIETKEDQVSGRRLS